MADDSGDEADGRDETLIPVDFQQTGQIRDDEVRGCRSKRVDAHYIVRLHLYILLRSSLRSSLSRCKPT